MSASSPGIPDRRQPSNAGAARTSLQRVSRPAAVASSGASVPAVLQTAPSVSDLWRGLQRHLLLALSLGLVLGTGAAAAAWFLLPSPKYTTSSLLYVASSAPKLLDVGAGQSNGLIQSYQKTQDQLIRSRTVLGIALKNPEAAKLSMVRAKPTDEVIQWLAQNLRIDFAGDVMSISLMGDNPGEIITLVNAVTKAYLEEMVSKDKNDRKNLLGQLKKLYIDKQEALQAKRKEYENLANRAGTSDQQTISLKHQLDMEEIGLARRELAVVRAEKREVQIERDMRVELDQPSAAPAEADAAKPAAALPQPDPAELKTAVENHPTTLDLRGQVQDLRRTLSGYRHVSRSNSDPAIRKVVGELQAAETALASHQARLRGDLVRQYQQESLAASAAPTQTRQGPAESVVVLEKKLMVLGKHEDEIARTIAEQESKFQNLNQMTLELQAARDKIDYVKRTVDQLGLTTERMDVELEAPERVKPLEDATFAQPISLRKKVMATGMVGLGTLSLILCSFAWLDARTRRVDRVDDVVRGLGVNLVGVLPALPGRSQRRLNRGGNWEHLLMESVDATRTMLLHTSRTEQLRVLMVTSAVKAEGKTSLACHLATSLARARQRTLLIDCDLRSPAIHALFDLPGGPGVCELLRGEITLSDAVQATAAPGLSLITAGRCDATALSALAHGRLQDLLKSVRDQYDFIIVDSAPVLPVADSLQISRDVDAVIFSVLRDVSRLPRIHEAYSRLENLGARMLGAVVAGAQTNHGYYTYGSYGEASTTSGTTVVSA